MALRAAAPWAGAQEAMAMRVRDIMTRQVYTLETTDTIEHAAALLAGRKITAAPVLDAAGRLVGMVSEGDLLWHRVPPDPTAHMRRGSDRTDRPKLVRDVMSGNPVTARPEADLSDVAQLMLHHGVRSLPILQEGRIVGIVSRRDVLRTVVRGDDVLRHEVQHRLDEYADGRRRWAVTVTDGVAAIDGRFADESERTIVTVIARTVPGIAEVRTLQPVG